MFRVSLVAIAIAIAVAATAAPAAADERVDVTAMDGTQLIAELGGTAGPGVVLVHGAGHDRRQWTALAAALAENGYRPLRLDLRGHGESSGAVDLTAADRDVEGAYRYLLGRKIRPVALIGEGVGGSAVLVVAARVPVAAVAALGRQPAAGGPDPRPALAAVRAPILLLVPEGDQDTKTFASTVSSARTVIVREPDVLASPATLPALRELLANVAR